MERGITMSTLLSSSLSVELLPQIIDIKYHGCFTFTFNLITKGWGRGIFASYYEQDPSLILTL